MRCATRHRAMRWISLLVLLLALGGGVQPAKAGGPRFVTGQNWGVPAGGVVVWNAAVLPYFTDPGPLSPEVNHAQADAMVAAAAAVWNVPTSSISFLQGGQLAEDVSLLNTSFDGTNVVFPADVQPANERNVPVAIVYDSDGGLIDLLLGQGASDPDSCRQNAVVGDVDDIHTSDGLLHHATLLLNGRCVGTAPEQMTEMQYQLARAFGRVLGLSWSQCNDNVFTGAATITANQMAYWPLMHPLDVICGVYSFQCMTNPFTLRADDLNSLGDLYPVYQASVPAGKQGTDNDALWVWGIVFFPSGQAMDWLNVTTRRQNNGVQEDWQTTSSTTGYLYTQALGTPVDPTPAVDAGMWSGNYEGYFSFRRTPLNGISNLFFVSEAINPLYEGDEAIGPYVRPPAAPSGSPTTQVAWSALSSGDSPAYFFGFAGDAASTCNPGADGTEGSPAAPDASGWQNGLLCGWGHSSWWSLPVAAGHSWTLEVTSTDETGAATVNKAQPVLGIWNATDPTGTLPTVASEAAPFNSLSLGMTQIQMPAAPTDAAYRISTTDQYGAGRPDFTYTARFLYAASVTPATLGAGGGRIAVTGSGFREGMEVLVNGAPAHVLTVTANQVVADAPTLVHAAAPLGVPVVVTVSDPGTGGSATVPDALRYTASPNLLQLVSAPVAVETGNTATVPFALRVVSSDGLSPVPDETVQISVLSGVAGLDVCDEASPCRVQSDEQGVASVRVTGMALGTITLQAVEVDSGAIVQVELADTDPVRGLGFMTGAQYVAAGAGGSWAPVVDAVQDGLPAAGVAVRWTLSAGLNAPDSAGLTGADGSASLQVGAMRLEGGSTNTVTACAWAALCATWTVYGVDPSQWLLQSGQGSTQSVPAASALAPVMLLVTDLAGHPLGGAPVQVYQRVLASEGVCPPEGRCAAAPVLAATQTTVYTDAAGQVQVTPLQVDAVPQDVQIAATTGTQRLLTLTLHKTP